MGRTLILSPHPDDAVLSAWSVLTAPGDVHVLNLFAGAPTGRPEPGWWDRLTGAGDSVSRAHERLAEDSHALSLAGRSASSLGFLDRQYRDGDQPLAALSRAVAQRVPDDALVMAPAALGSHADHEHAREVGLELRRRGIAVAFYADLPHASDRGWPPSASAPAWARSRVRTLSDAELRRKMEAVRCYGTQLGALEDRFSIVSDPEVLRYEVFWPPRSGRAAL